MKVLVGAVGSDFKMAHSRDGAGCWQEALVPLHMGFFSGLLMCPHGMAAGSPHIKSFKRARRKRQCFWDLHGTS